MRAIAHPKFACTLVLISSLASVTSALPSFNVKPMNLPSFSGQTKLYPVTSGTWGGQSVSFEVGKTGVKIEFDCAEGEIPNQLKADKKGNFKIEGTLTSHPPGPVRRDAVPHPAPAMYEGTIKGNVINLKVTLLKTNESAGEFTIERGKTPTLHRCY